MLEDQILDSLVRNQFQKDADPQFRIYCLPFGKQEQQIVLYCLILFSVVFPTAYSKFYVGNLLLITGNAYKLISFFSIPKVSRLLVYIVKI